MGFADDLRSALPVSEPETGNRLEVITKNEVLLRCLPLFERYNLLALCASPHTLDRWLARDSACILRVAQNQQVLSASFYVRETPTDVHTTMSGVGPVPAASWSLIRWAFWRLGIRRTYGEAAPRHVPYFEAQGCVRTGQVLDDGRIQLEFLFQTCPEIPGYPKELSTP
jgi:hypothetical protein